MGPKSPQIKRKKASKPNFPTQKSNRAIPAQTCKTLSVAGSSPPPLLNPNKTLKNQNQQVDCVWRIASMDGLKVSDADLVVYVHPSKSHKVPQAILRELSSLLFKFSETFDGVVLAYDVNVHSKNAKILSGIHPYLGVKLQAKLLLFHPKPDMLLEGKVVKLSQQSIHIIILGFSSAIITEEDIREEFKYKIKHGEEVFVSSSNKRHKIKVGTILRFLVKSFDEEILHISGSLQPAHTGSVRWLDKHMEDWSNADRITKKRKESGEKQDVQSLDNTMLDVGTISTNNDHRHKKSKRQRSGEDS